MSRMRFKSREDDFQLTADIYKTYY